MMKLAFTGIVVAVLYVWSPFGPFAEPVVVPADTVEGTWIGEFRSHRWQEISESLGIGLSATKMRIKRARELFRERYEAGGDEPSTPSQGSSS